MAPVIGFDFDECLAQGYTFTPFALFLEVLLPRALKQPSVSATTRVLLEKARAAFYQRVALNEASSKGTLIRPSLLRILPKLLELRQNGTVASMFLYSNNGIRALIDVMDHILALTLLRDPYKVPENQLIKDADGRLHCLTPRAYIDDPCRASEPKEANGFREKSFAGIQSCLGMGITTDQLWYLDDTRTHDSLMNSIKDHYIVVKPYNVRLANRKLAEMFVESFPNATFQPASREGVVALTELQTLLPGFHPNGRESEKALVEKLVKELGKFSPLGSGRVLRNWTDAETAADTLAIQRSLAPAMTWNQVAPDAETAAAYRVAVGGHKGRTRGNPKSSRSRRNRGDRTRRRKEM